MKKSRRDYRYYAAIDAERADSGGYPARNYLIARSLVKEVLRYYENGPKFVIALA